MKERRTRVRCCLIMKWVLPCISIINFALQVLFFHASAALVTKFRAICGIAVIMVCTIIGCHEQDEKVTMGEDPLLPVCNCTVPSMIEAYPGIFPQNPYKPWEEADDCLVAEHHVILVMGCPNNADGSASMCQIARADLAVAFMNAGYGRRFITTGGAVHTPEVEAETLKGLLMERGVPEDAIWLEPRARHTDENIYYSSLIMENRGWPSAIVISNDPGHLMMVVLCDSNCCVSKGRLSLHTFPLWDDGRFEKAGHYVLFPHARNVNREECDHIEFPLKFMCTQLPHRLFCMDESQRSERR